MKIVSCTFNEHGEEIRQIFNYAIEHTTAIYDYSPRTVTDIKQWFDQKNAHNFPVIGLSDNANNLLAFGSYGTFRPRAAYKYTVEHSIYVHHTEIGNGFGSKLLALLIEHAEKQNYHSLIGGIDLQNTASIALHEKFGFTQVGIIKEAAFKFGRWLDLGFFQLVLSTPKNPCDG